MSASAARRRRCAAGRSLFGSEAGGESPERVLHAFPGLRAAQPRRPTRLAELFQPVVGDRPLILEVALVEQELEGQATIIRLDALAQRDRNVERGEPRAVDDEHIAGGAAQIAHAQRRHVILAREVPQNEVDAAIGKLDGFLVDLHAHGGQIGVGENALDIAPHEACLADGEAAEHAYLLLQRGLRRGHRYSSIPTVKVTRRLSERAVSVPPLSCGSSGPAPRTASRSGSTPRFLRSARTASARAPLSAILNMPVPVAASAWPVTVTRVVMRRRDDTAASSLIWPASPSRTASCAFAGSGLLLSK